MRFRQRTNITGRAVYISIYVLCASPVENSSAADELFSHTRSNDRPERLLAFSLFFFPQKETQEIIRREHFHLSRFSLAITIRMCREWNESHVRMFFFLFPALMFGGFLPPPSFFFFSLFLLFFYTTPAILTFIERETQIRHLELFSKHPFTFSFPFVFFLNRLLLSQGRAVSVWLFLGRASRDSLLFSLLRTPFASLFFLFFLHLLFFIISLFQFLWVFFLSL